MEPLELIAGKRQHLQRLANEHGAEGETAVVDLMDHWLRRPKGKGLRILISALELRGIHIRWSSFDAVSLPEGRTLDFRDSEAVERLVDEMVFIEIKTANQPRVEPGFGKFFFALTESEIEAAAALGARHRIALFNRLTGELQMTSVREIVDRARSMTWQVSVQL